METYLKAFDAPPDRSCSDAEKYQKRQKLFGSTNVYPMWVADMEFEVAPSIGQALARRVAHGIFGYSEPDAALFDLAASWLEQRLGITVEATMIRSSPSIMTSMSAAIEALSDKNDGVTVLTPIYPPFLETVTTQERILHTVTLLDTPHGFCIDWEAFEAALKHSRLFLLCNPHNPVGRVWRTDELERIATLCEHYGVAIISDDAHADIISVPHRYRNISTITPTMAHQSVTLFGPGKGFNISGLGATLFFTHNKEYLARIEKVFKARHIVAGNVMGYTALKAAYGGGHAWLDAVNAYLAKNLAYAHEKINAHPHFSAHKIEGTYLMWVNCKALGLGDLALKEYFVSRGIGPSLGRLFGSGGSGFVRLNLAVPFETLKTVLDRLLVRI